MEIKNFKKLAKKIGFPGGECTNDFTKAPFPGCSMHWYKRGGHAGRKTIDRVVEKAKKAGFKSVESLDSFVPDGSYVSNGDKYVKSNRLGTVTLVTSMTYGPTKYENSFSIVLRAVQDPE